MQAPTLGTQCPALRPRPSALSSGRSGPRRLAAFLLLQALILTAGGTWGGYRATRQSAERALPVLRNQPLALPPLYDDPQIVSDEQLRRALHKLMPRFPRKETKINHVDHALRFWGVNARFDDPDCMSGAEMRSLLLDHRTFAKVWPATTPPLLIDVGRGVRVRVQNGHASSSHVDHTLAAQAEVGTPLDFPVWTPSQQTTLRALLEQSLRDFSLNQVEYEWAALTYALYLPPTTRWRTSEGQEITFDRLAERIMRQDLPQGVCYGNHRLQTLAVMLRVDEQTRIFSDLGRRRVRNYLQDVTRRLVQSQHADGYWTRSWAGELGQMNGENGPAEDTLDGRILATGHALEWWAVAPRELHAPREVLVAAGQWLCRTIDELTPQQVKHFYTPLSHAGHALALWRGRQPANVKLDP